MRCIALVLTVLVVPSLFAQEKPEQAAQKSAEAWLAIVDSGDAPKSWEEAAQGFKAQVTKEQWEDSLKKVHDQTGKLKSRTFLNAQLTENPPGAPAGKYVLIQYNSTFEKAAGVETVVPMQEKDGSWRVSGYFFKPSGDQNAH